MRYLFSSSLVEGLDDGVQLLDCYRHGDGRRRGGLCRNEAVCDVVIFFEMARGGGIGRREGSQKKPGPVTAVSWCRRVLVGGELGDGKGGLAGKSVGGRGREEVKLCLGGTARLGR